MLAFQTYGHGNHHLWVIFINVVILRDYRDARAKAPQFFEPDIIPVSIIRLADEVDFDTRFRRRFLGQCSGIHCNGENDERTFRSSLAAQVANFATYWQEPLQPTQFAMLYGVIFLLVAIFLGALDSWRQDHRRNVLETPLFWWLSLLAMLLVLHFRDILARLKA